jgi:probable phosphoglycerate mutase
VITVIAVRHGETDWNRVRRLQGHTDIALNAAGVEQAARLAAVLASERIVAIHTSDLARARATAEPIAAALGLVPVIDPRLRERNYGVLEGLTHEEIREVHPEHADRMDARDPDHAAPRGETPALFSARIVGAVTSIARAGRATHGPDATILVVTHGGALAMLYRHAAGIALDARELVPVPNAAINRLTFDDERLRVVEWATIP